MEEPDSSSKTAPDSAIQVCVRVSPSVHAPACYSTHAWTELRPWSFRLDASTDRVPPPPYLVKRCPTLRVPQVRPINDRERAEGHRTCVTFDEATKQVVLTVRSY